MLRLFFNGDMKPGMVFLRASFEVCLCIEQGNYRRGWRLAAWRRTAICASRTACAGDMPPPPVALQLHRSAVDARRNAADGMEEQRRSRRGGSGHQAMQLPQ